MEEFEVVARQLRRHAVRRNEDVPTVSLLVGGPALLPQIERLLAPVPLVQAGARDTTLTALAQLWLNAVMGRYDLTAIALAVVEPSSHEDAQAAWRARSPAERAQWLAHLIVTGRDERVVSGARWLSEHHGAQAARAGAGAGPVALVQLLVAWLPKPLWPALCVTAERPAELDAVVALSLAVPRLPLIAVISEGTLSRLAESLDGRTCALLLEGLIATGTPSRGAAPEPAPRPARNLPPPAASVDAEQLEDLRREAETALHAARQARALGEGDTSEAEERARSLAELLLYQLLQREPATRDLFALNALMPFDFGPRPAEIDLVSVALKLAIEVDGYHHFTDAGCYRRDRRKDLLLQTQGFWISRYLASDVIEQSEQIVRSVVEVVQQRNNLRGRAE